MIKSLIRITEELTRLRQLDYTCAAASPGSGGVVVSWPMYSQSTNSGQIALFAYLGF